MDFDGLAALQREIATLQDTHVKALNHYHCNDFCGFRHKYVDDPAKYLTEFSKASTGTCVLSLVSAGKWTANEPWSQKTDKLLEELLKCEWSSADLGENPFTVAFIFDAFAALLRMSTTWSPDGAAQAMITKGVNILLESIKGGGAADAPRGAALLKGYPPSTYLTQLVVRVLKRLHRLGKRPRALVRKWAWSQVEHELALMFTESKLSDPYALAYAVVLVSMTSSPSELTPDEEHIIRKSVDKVFEAQLADGSWPRSRPIFHYPSFGNAYCYEYEMLVQLLNEDGLQEHYLRHLDKLGLATNRLGEKAYRLRGGALGWASDHHPQLKGPESWSTASVFHFLHTLDRVLAEAVRRNVFEYIGAEYRSPEERSASRRGFAPGMLDSYVHIGKGARSLKKAIYESFVLPAAQNAPNVVRGQSMPPTIPIAAIFYGPPGTSKTTLARLIGDSLGWPLLTIDPSHLVRKGLDQVQAETNTVFSMLAALERVVVLLDEFDEMLRERTEKESEVLSRFLTTAMLPKLANVNNKRRILVIIATNHVEQFDFAIRRPGRIDLLVQIMPPRLDQKLREWPEVPQGLTRLGLTVADNGVAQKLKELTYIEFHELANRLKGADSKADALGIIEESYSQSTLQGPSGGVEKPRWSDLCKEQRRYMRIPGIGPGR